MRTDSIDEINQEYTHLSLVQPTVLLRLNAGTMMPKRDFRGIACLHPDGQWRERLYHGMHIVLPAPCYTRPGLKSA